MLLSINKHVVRPENSYSQEKSIMRLSVRNDDVGHRLLEIVLPFQELVAAPIAVQDYPSPATDACASNDNV